jgi:hemerythrin-like domain-containing protein
MRALESLERDHRLLQGLTEALEVYVTALEEGQPLCAGDLSDIVLAFRTVADYRHFEKVEEVLIPLLVRSGFDGDLGRLDHDGREERGRVRYLIEVLHQSAERELNWNLDERQRIARAARHLIDELRRISARQAVELFPEIVTRLDHGVLGQLTEQLCQFDDANAARSPELDIAALHRSVLERYARSLQPRSAPARDLPNWPEQSAVESGSLEPAVSSALQSSRDLPSTRELAR